MNNVILAGGGSYALNLGTLIEESGGIIYGYTDIIDTGLQWPFLGKDQEASLGVFPENVSVIIAIGTDTGLREKLYRIWSKSSVPFFTFIHRQSYVCNTAEIGSGCVLFPHSSLGAQAILQNNVALCTGSIVEHETIIGNHSYLAPGTVISGRVVVGRKCMFGSNSTVTDSIEIKDGTILGAASLLLHPVHKVHGTYVGSPARRLCIRIKS